MIGQTVSHYKILEKLGEGGMGVVYRAEDTKLKRSVALKFLAPEITHDKDSKKRFITEAQAASALDHPNIAVVHEIDETDDGRSFICMSYYDGESLKDRIKNGPLSIEESLRITIQIAGGLERAHEAGIIHRDIKPANILITRRNEVKIVDFGIAKLTSETQTSQTLTTPGTTAYMSPEQLRGTAVDQRTDLFSLGVVLYEMVTGRRPFTGEHEAAIIYLIMNVEAEPPSHYRNEISLELDRLILRLLEKDPFKRYQNGRELRQDIQQLLGLTVTAFPIKSEIPKLIARIKAFIPAVAIAVLLLFLAFPLRGPILRLLGIGTIPQEKHIVILPFTVIGEHPDSRAFSDGLMEILTSKLTQVSRGQMWVVAASEVRQQNIASVREARKAFGVTLAISGSVQFAQNRILVTLNLVDPKTSFQLNSAVFETDSTSSFTLQDKTMASLAEILNIQLDPREIQALSSGGTSISDAYNFYVQARGYLQRYESVENINRAIELLRMAIQKDSTFALAFAGLGEAYWRKYETVEDVRWANEAIRYGKHSIQLNGQLTPIRITLGIILRGTGKTEEAVRELQKALEIDSHSHDAYRELAVAYENLGRINQAEKTYQKAIELQPLYWAGHNQLGVFYYRYGRYREAAAQFHRVVELTPDNVRGYVNVGGIYYLLGRFDEAEKMFRRSLLIDPTYDAYSNLGTLYYMQGRYREAAQMYQGALELNNTDYKVWGNLAAAYYWMPGEREKSREIYLRAINEVSKQLNVNPEDPVKLSALAEYYSDIDEFDKSLLFINKALARAPKNGQVNFRAGWIFERQGNREKALEWIGKAIAMGYSRAEIEREPGLQELRNDIRYRNLK